MASLDHFNPEMLGSAELVEEVQTGESKLVKVSENRRIDKVGENKCEVQT